MSQNMDDTSKLLSDILAEVDFLFERDGINATLTRTEYRLMLKIAKLDEILSTPGDSCLLPGRWDTAVKYTDNDIVEDAYLDAVAISRGE